MSAKDGREKKERHKGCDQNFLYFIREREVEENQISKLFVSFGPK